MNVFGVNVDQENIDAAVGEIIADRKNFTARDMESRLKWHGVDAKSAYRCADRTLQKLRRNGKIFFSDGLWYVS